MPNILLNYYKLKKNYIYYILHYIIYKYKDIHSFLNKLFKNYKIIHISKKLIFLKTKSLATIINTFLIFKTQKKEFAFF